MFILLENRRIINLKLGSTLKLVDSPPIRDETGILIYQINICIDCISLGYHQSDELSQSS